MALRIGILLAAGRSQRMGQFKQLLPWHDDGGDKTLVAASYDAVSDACDEMIVIVGHRADEVTNVLTPRKFSRVDTDPWQPMFESILAGLHAAVRICPQAAVLIQPADHPQVNAAALQALVRLADHCPQRVIIPEYEACGGHPVLIPPKIIPLLFAWPGDGGLRQFWRENSHLCERLAVGDPGVVRDFDTPQDYFGFVERTDGP